MHSAVWFHFREAFSLPLVSFITHTPGFFFILFYFFGTVLLCSESFSIFTLARLRKLSPTNELRKILDMLCSYLSTSKLQFHYQRLGLAQSCFSQARWRWYGRLTGETKDVLCCNPTLRPRHPPPPPGSAQLTPILPRGENYSSAAVACGIFNTRRFV